jgi:small subunit ribosomal protein S13
MARISGIDIPNNLRVEVGLTYIFGIGISRARKILNSTKVNPDTKVKDLSEADIEKIRNFIEANYKIEGELKTEITQNIKRLKEIGTYRGERHSKNLPVRGQRTKTNARTKRGKRVTVGSGRKPTAEKT